MDHRMIYFPDTPGTTASSAKQQERDVTLSIIIAGLQRVVRGEHSHDEQERIIRNAAMLLADIAG
jgi:hypothetical protein